MQEVNITKRAEAIFVGMIGDLGVYVAKHSVEGWDQGSVGLVTQSGTLLLNFSKNINWLENPRAEDKRMHLELKSPTYEAFKEHWKSQRDLLKTTEIDPMKGYLLVGHLFLDGYSLFHHLNWSSYLMNRIAKMLKRDHVINKLLAI